MWTGVMNLALIILFFPLIATGLAVGIGGVLLYYTLPTRSPYWLILAIPLGLVAAALALAVSVIAWIPVAIYCLVVPFTK